MTEEHDQQLNQLFRSAFQDLSEEEFRTGVMDQVKRHDRYLGILSLLTYLAVLAAVWFFSPEIQSVATLIAMSPPGATPSLPGEMLTSIRSPLLIFFGAACAGYFLINVISGVSEDSL